VGIEKLRRELGTLKKVNRFAYLWLGLASIAALSVPPFGARSVNDMSSGTIDGDVGAGDRDQGTFPLLVRECSCTLEGDLGTISSWLEDLINKLTVVPVFNLVRSRVVPAGTVMSLIMIVVQEALPEMAAAASVNVQLARASRLAGAAATSAPAPRRREVTCMATMMPVEENERI
jgi:hypothetical protein